MFYLFLILLIFIGEAVVRLGGILAGTRILLG